MVASRLERERTAYAPTTPPNLRFGISCPKTVTLSDILVTRLSLSRSHTHAFVILITSLLLDFF